ncbi:LacI family DNA-binding transcriptional regulator [Streptomonospora nanhaiensis]|uniref:LacI family DNA-binding transcriptional regulator n=1 Tax=Streptomonospora nanhaiensis TaxID=1323731 RepID=UPI0015CAFCC8|nr:LacI family DNA-binding transcriptional regulator [Streptomonospora nanhaiensis]MBV2363067.1 LacI family transcriptional regulator [Streptomonospora nanhaiensis]MBX9388917.1 LacI family transcriptional regulator [Streptomonospora nanhaiensis]
MGPRLSDVARHAEVSEATVSRVLNNKPGVGAETRSAVLTALDVLGYERPERLRRRSAGLVGMVVPELENPVFPMFAQAAEGALARQGYTPVLCTRPLGGIVEDEYVELLLERNVSGIIFVSGLHADTTADHGRYHRLISQKLPIVLVNGYAEEVPAAFVSCDDREAGRLAVNHLAELGHTRIGFASGPERYVPVQRKLAGYREAMAAHGLDGEALVELSQFGVEGGHAAAQLLLRRGVTAIVCGSDLMALGAVRAARQQGLSVPGDFSVVGYDDSQLIAFTDPPLTTVRQPVHAMAVAAVRSLCDEIAGHPVARTEYLFDPELVVRGSTAAAPRKAPLGHATAS